jgi:hypothetical protein
MRKNLFLFLFFVFLTNSSFAGVSVVGELTQRKSVKPGEKYDGIILVKNTGEEFCSANIYQTDYLFYADGKNIYGKPGSSPRSNAKWITLSPNQVRIAPKDTVSVYYAVKVPEIPDLKGTYWSAVMIEPVAEPSREIKEGKGVIGIQTIIRYLIQIVTNIGDTGNVKIEFLDKKLIWKDNKRILQIDVKNVGERELSPSVWAQLYNETGIEIGRFESSRLRIFPDCSVRHNIDLTDVSKGQYKALVVLDNGDENVFGAEYNLEIK